jgi:uncharacterized protein (TIGR02117 family)
VVSAAIFAGVMTLLAWACAAPTVERQISMESAHAKRVFVVHDKWHAAIVVSKNDISAGAIPELTHFPRAQYIEFSWGDADFFPAAERRVSLALKAAFLSRGSVLHLVGFNGPIKEMYPGAQVIEIALSDTAFSNLVNFLAEEFKRDGSGVAAEPSPGLSARSRFFPANSKFSVFRTCNAWVAEAFVAAGLPLRPRLVFTAGDLAVQLRSHAIQPDAQEPTKGVGQVPRGLVNTV